MLEHHHDVLKAHGYHPLRVAKVVPETDDTKTFVLDVPDPLRQAFKYTAGQFCTFRVRTGGTEYLRSYSMSSAPEVDPRLAVTVKRVPDGVISNWFNDRVTEGDTLDVTRPAGVFCPTGRAGPVVAFCGGSGITPVLSVTKSILTTTRRRIRLVYANRNPASVIFDKALQELSDRHDDRLDLVYHFDSDRGYLRTSDVVRGCDGMLDGAFYICGPTAFMDLVEGSLLDLGVPPDRILIERFDVDDADRTAPVATPLPGGASARAVTVVLKGRPTTVAYRPGDTILDTARRAGLQPPSSCEAGNCATCMAFLKEGAVTMRVNNALSPDEVNEGWVLTCQGIPASETVTVEYESL